MSAESSTYPCPSCGTPSALDAGGETATCRSGHTWSRQRGRPHAARRSLLRAPLAAMVAADLLAGTLVLTLPLRPVLLAALFLAGGTLQGTALATLWARTAMETLLG